MKTLSAMVPSNDVSTLRGKLRPLTAGAVVCTGSTRVYEDVSQQTPIALMDEAKQEVSWVLAKIYPRRPAVTSYKVRSWTNNVVKRSRPGHEMRRTWGLAGCVWLTVHARVTRWSFPARS